MLAKNSTYQKICIRGITVKAIYKLQARTEQAGCMQKTSELSDIALSEIGRASCRERV